MTTANTSGQEKPISKMLGKGKLFPGQGKLISKLGKRKLSFLGSGNPFANTGQTEMSFWAIENYNRFSRVKYCMPFLRSGY